MSPQHTLSTLRKEGHTVLMLAGELDTANADEMADAVRGELAAGPVLLDLSGLAFMDSSGLRMLTELVRDAEESDWSFTIGHDLPPMISRLLEMSGMLERLPIEGRQTPE